MIRRATESECWLWEGATAGMGYGVVSIEGKSFRVARHIYRLFVGPVTPEQVVMHTCDTPACCNPAHLKVGTHKDNMLDREAKGRTRGMFYDGDDVRRKGGKMTALWAKQIRFLKPLGFTNGDLATAYGCGEGNVQQIVTYKTWRDV